MDQRLPSITKTDLRQLDLLEFLQQSRPGFPSGSSPSCRPAARPWPAHRPRCTARRWSRPRRASRRSQFEHRPWSSLLCTSMPPQTSMRVVAVDLVQPHVQLERRAVGTGGVSARLRRTAPRHRSARPPRGWRCRRGSMAPAKAIMVNLSSSRKTKRRGLSAWAVWVALRGGVAMYATCQCRYWRMDTGIAARAARANPCGFRSLQSRMAFPYTRPSNAKDVRELP